MKHCALCGLKPPIENSHIISAFVFRWLKEGTPHQTLRHSDDLTKSYQDGWKDEYFCVDCEQKFGQWENWFSKNVFKPFASGKQQIFKLSEEAALFAASIHYRCLVRAFDKSPDHSPDPEVKSMYEHLKRVCLDGIFPTTGFNNYLEFVPLITPSHPGWPPGVNTYIREAVDGAVFPWILSDTQCLKVSYVKLPSMIFLFSESEIGSKMGIPPLFDPYRIQAAGTLKSSDQGLLLLHMMRDTVIMRAHEIQASYAKIPQKQRDKILKRILSHPHKESFRAHETYMADMVLLEKWISGEK